MNPIFNDSTVARVLLVLVLIAGVFFFRGFVVPVLAALVICFASWPLYQNMLDACGNRRLLAASIAIGLILLCLIIPIVVAITYAFQEVSSWIHWFHVANPHGIPAPQWLMDLPGGGEWLAEKWNLYLNEPHAPAYILSLVSGQNISGISSVV